MENCKHQKYRWLILSAYMFVAALTQLFWVNFASIDTFVEKSIGISAMKVGFLTMIFPLTFLILSIPAGIIIDRKGYKFSMMLGAAFTTVFAVFRIISPISYTILFVSQLGISLGQPFILNSVTKLSTLCFPKDEEATAVGLGSLSLFIGMIIGMGLTPILVQRFSFTNMIVIYAVISIIGIAFLYFADKGMKEQVNETKSTFTQYVNGIKNVLKIRDLIILGGISFIAIGSFNGILTWLEKILNEMHKIPMGKAGTIATALIFSGMVGCFVIPELSDKIKKRKPFLILGLLVASISLIVFSSIKGSFHSDMAVLSIMGFFAISVFPLMLTMSAEISGAKYAGFSASFLQLLGNGAAVIIVPLINFSRTVSGNYKIALLSISILFLFAVFLSANLYGDNFSVSK
jgi:MFS family permease